MNLLLLLPLVPLHEHCVVGFTTTSRIHSRNWAVSDSDGAILREGKQALHLSALPSSTLAKSPQQHLDVEDDRLIHPTDTEGVNRLHVLEEAEGVSDKNSKLIVNNENADRRNSKVLHSEKKIENNNTVERAKPKQVKKKSKAKMRTIISEGGSVATIKKAIKDRKKGRSYLLGKEEEYELVHKVHDLRRVMNMKEDFQAFNNGDIPTHEEWAQMMEPPISSVELKQIIREGHEARARLLAGNVGLVVKIAKHFSRKQGIALTLSDLTQEGSLGLLEAAERFNPGRGYKFSTYATWWVRQRISKAITDHSRAIRLPAHVHTMISRVDKARKEFEQDVGRVPSLPELAYDLTVPIEKLKMYEDSSQHALSLERPLSKDTDNKSLVGDLVSSDSQTPDDFAEINCLRENVRSIVSELSAKERDVLVLRFGLNDGSAMTIQESSKVLGISKDRVRLIEARALNKLRHPGRTDRLKGYAGVLADESEEISEEEYITHEDYAGWLF